MTTIIPSPLRMGTFTNYDVQSGNMLANYLSEEGVRKKRVGSNDKLRINESNISKLLD